MQPNISELKFLFDAKHIVIFGASSGGCILQNYLIQNGIDVTSFSDNDPSKWGMKIKNKIVIEPDKIPKNSLVVIASNWARDISEKLNKLGLRNVDLTCWDNRWRINFDFERLDNNLIDQQSARKLISDKNSLEIWDAYLTFRRTGDASVLKPSSFNFYGHPKASVNKNDIVFDVGSYDAETAKYFCECGASFVYTFEPDLENFKLVQENIKKWGLDNIIGVNKGFWNETATLQFIKDPLYGNQNRISKTQQKEGKLTNLSFLTIDEFCSEKNIRPDLIKMDIEGAETNVLLGGRKIIETYRPKLQICLYHEWNDLWEIPKLLNEMNPDYNFYLGHHSQNLFELVLYAVSNK